MSAEVKGWRWTLASLERYFLSTAEQDAVYYLGEDDRRPVPVEYPYLVQREDYNRLVRFVRERLG